MNAYCQLIAEASHAIYIENQFFCTNTTAGALREQLGLSAELTFLPHQAKDVFRTSSGRRSSSVSSVRLAQGRSLRSSLCELCSPRACEGTDEASS